MTLLQCCALGKGTLRNFVCLVLVPVVEMDSVAEQIKLRSGFESRLLYTVNAFLKPHDINIDFIQPHNRKYYLQKKGFPTLRCFFSGEVFMYVQKGVCQYLWLEKISAPVASRGFLSFFLSHPVNTFFRLIPLTLFVSRNRTLIHRPLSGSLDFLLCDSIAPTPDLVFFLLMSQMLAAASSFSSSIADSSLSFLPPLFLRLTPTLIMWRSTSV